MVDFARFCRAPAVLGLVALLQLQSSALGMVTSPIKNDCSACQNTFNQIGYAMNDPRLKSKINLGLKNVCDQYLNFSSAFREELCKPLVNQYYDSLLSNAAQLLSSSEICPAMKLLQATEPFLKHDKKCFIHNEGQLKQTEICEFCTDTMNFVHSTLNTNQNLIENVLNEFCDLFPHLFRSTCQSYIQQIMYALLQMSDPKIACTELCDGVERVVGVDDRLIENQN